MHSLKLVHVQLGYGGQPINVCQYAVQLGRLNPALNLDLLEASFVLALVDKGFHARAFSVRVLEFMSLDGIYSGVTGDDLGIPYHYLR